MEKVVVNLKNKNNDNTICRKQSNIQFVRCDMLNTRC